MTKDDLNQEANKMFRLLCENRGNPKRDFYHDQLMQIEKQLDEYDIQKAASHEMASRVSPALVAESD